jgi:hypothetical protein
VLAGRGGGAGAEMKAERAGGGGPRGTRANKKRKAGRRPSSSPAVLLAMATAAPVRPTPARAHLLADKHAVFIASFAKVGWGGGARKERDKDARTPRNPSDLPLPLLSIPFFSGPHHL